MNQSLVGYSSMRFSESGGKVRINTIPELIQWLQANEHMAMLHCVRFSIDQGFTRAQIKEAMDGYMLGSYGKLQS